MKMLVCGGRDFTHRTLLFSVLDRIHALRPIVKIVAGGQRGADKLAVEWAISRDVDFQEYEADWAFYGKRAGSVRNAQMLREESPNLVVAFPTGGPGTRDMITKAKEAQVKTIVVRRDIQSPERYTLTGE